MIPTTRGGGDDNALDAEIPTEDATDASNPRRACNNVFLDASRFCFAAFNRLALAEPSLVVDALSDLRPPPLDDEVPATLPPWSRFLLRLEAVARLFFLLVCLSFPARCEWPPIVGVVACIVVYGRFEFMIDSGRF